MKPTGKPTEWPADIAERIRQAKAGDGLKPLAAELGCRYSTLTAHARKLGLGGFARPKKSQNIVISPFNGRVRSGNAPEGEAITPAHVRVQLCPSHPIDERFQCDPASKPYGAGFMEQWKQLRGES